MRDLSDTLFEAHVTVDTDDIERWRWICGVHGIKPLCIELDSGEHPRQVMCAATMVGTYLDALNWFEALTQQIDDVLPVIRTKLECPLDKASIFDDPVYYECHAKLLMPVGTTWDRLREPCLRAGVHASRNLLRLDHDPFQKYYLTRRVAGCDVHTAARTFNDSLAEIRWHEPAVRMEMECVIIDSHPELDAGWAST